MYHCTNCHGDFSDEVTGHSCTQTNNGCPRCQGITSSNPHQKVEEDFATKWGWLFDAKLPIDFPQMFVDWEDSISAAYQEGREEALKETVFKTMTEVAMEARTEEYKLKAIEKIKQAERQRISSLLEKMKKEYQDKGGYGDELRVIEKIIKALCE